METIRIIPDLEQQGFEDTPYQVTEIAAELIIGGMANGTEAGKPTVLIGIKIEDGSYLVKQSTLALFLTAADTLKAKYGDPRV